MRKTHIYIVRCWAEGAPQENAWRFVLEEPLNGTVRGFTNIEQVLTIIQQEFASNQPEENSSVGT